MTQSEERKMFFSEEKNQKTSMPPPAARSSFSLEPGAAQKTKVFCFFSSEKKILPYLFTILTLALVAPCAQAHHSFAMYDPAITIKLDGTVKEFQWTNPHALLWVVGVTRPGEDPALWTIELPTSPGNLSRLGWSKHSLSPGDKVIVELNPLRDGKHGGSFRKMTMVATGQVLLVNLRDQPKTEAAK